MLKKFLVLTVIMSFAAGAFACDGSGNKPKEKKPESERSLTY